MNVHAPQRGELRMTLKRLFDGTPHIPVYLTSVSVGLGGLFNAIYGLTDSGDYGPYEIKIQ